MNIAIGKLGKSVKFNMNSWSAAGGDNEAPKLYTKLFHLNPNVNFYLIGGNDFRTLSEKEQNRINQHGNVFDVYGGFRDFEKTYDYNATEFNRIARAAKPPRKGSMLVDHILNWTRTSGIKIDRGIFFGGPTGTVNVMGYSTRMKEENELGLGQEFLAIYAGPILAFLNETKIPWDMIVNDPKFFPWHARDMFHGPARILSQYNETLEIFRKPSYEKSSPVVYETFTGRYAAVEKIFLIDLIRGKNDEESRLEMHRSGTLADVFADDTTDRLEKTIKFMIVCNRSKGPERYNLLKEGILDHVKDVDIYGRWDGEPRVEGDPRFKGPLPFLKLQKMLKNVKYTYCIPIKPGWCTAKFWEMAHYGIIPFVHPSYDEQNNIGIPEYCRVSSAKELNEKIEELENNEDKYLELRSTIENMITDKDYSGETLNKLFFP